jgi:hypothetical protein
VTGILRISVLFGREFTAMTICMSHHYVNIIRLESNYVGDHKIEPPLTEYHATEFISNFDDVLYPMSALLQKLPF